MNINQIQSEMRAAGSHWWDPDTMRFFGTRVVGAVQQGPGGVYFVTSDKRYDDSRGYTVRGYDPATKDVSTVGELAGYRAQREAMNAAAEAASGAPDTPTTWDATPHAPVTVLEQFVADLRAHGDAKRIEGLPDPEASARALMIDAARHHRLREHQCNGTKRCPTCDGGNDDCPDCDGSGVQGLAALKGRIKREADAFGARVKFSGDPRGCTVKLLFHDGATNDWGREGWCVPIR
jgi:hypothetical protein